jgi:hypothetical protein
LFVRDALDRGVDPNAKPVSIRERVRRQQQNWPANLSVRDANRYLIGF